MSGAFDYGSAFARNIGWITQGEQDRLRHARVAIAGLGGVGGSHLITLTRLGVGGFNLADFDTFELANFNRQAGASLPHLDQPKAATLANMARDINPQLNIQLFEDGVDPANVDEFLAGVDVYVDGLDFFAVSARRAVFAACHRLGIPAVTAAPLGMGAAVLNFLPGRMSFEDYFQLEDHDEQEQLLRFLVGLSPAMLQRGYLVDRSAVDFSRQRGPSTPMACELCAGFAATETLKLLLRRGRVWAAPNGMQYDAYRNKTVRTWRPGGNRHPVQRAALAIARRQLTKPAAQHHAPTPSKCNDHRSVVEQILDQARWAPSGDNTQPWRFEIHDNHSFTVHGYDTRSDCVYDLDGHASHLALGALLETVSIAASKHGLKAEVECRTDTPVEQPTFEIGLHPHPRLEPSPLARFIPIRATQRRPMKTSPLLEDQKKELRQAIGDGYEIRWFESLFDRMRIARLLVASAKIRLTTPEAFAVHSRIIVWHARYSEDRIPDEATGLDPLARRLTRWAFGDWRRVQLLNRYLGGTLLPRMELDLLPALACSAHFVIVSKQTPNSVTRYIEAGRAWQRFWLTATKLGLWSQPEMTPLIFSRYSREGMTFSTNNNASTIAEQVNARLMALLVPANHMNAVVMGRLGKGPKPESRSLRLPLDKLRVASAT